MADGDERMKSKGKGAHAVPSTLRRNGQTVSIIRLSMTVFPLSPLTYVKVGNEIALSAMGWFKSTATLFRVGGIAAQDR